MDRSAGQPADNPPNSDGLGAYHRTVPKLKVRIYWPPGPPIWQRFGLDPDQDPKWRSGTIANTSVGAHQPRFTLFYILPVSISPFSVRRRWDWLSIIPSVLILRSCISFCAVYPHFRAPQPGLGAPQFPPALLSLGCRSYIGIHTPYPQSPFSVLLPWEMPPQSPPVYLCLDWRSLISLLTPEYPPFSTLLR